MACSHSPDEGDLPYRHQVDAAADAELHVTVARAVAAARGEDPAATRDTLYDYVDPEALDRLYDHACRSDGADWEVAFTVGDHEVTLDSDGEIVVR